MLELVVWPSRRTHRVAEPDPPVDREAARLRAAELRAVGMSYAKIAAEVGIPRTTLMEWGRRGVI
jgi:hypothetical protein